MKLTDEQMLAQLNTEGGDAGSDFNDGDLCGYFGWSVEGDVLTIHYQPGDDFYGTTGERQERHWKLFPANG